MDYASAPPLPPAFVHSMQSECDRDPIDRIRWLLTTQSCVMHVLQSATLSAVSDSITVGTSPAADGDGASVSSFSFTSELCGDESLLHQVPSDCFMMFPYLPVMWCPAGPARETSPAHRKYAASKLAKFSERVLSHSAKQVPCPERPLRFQVYSCVGFACSFSISCLEHRAGP